MARVDRDERDSLVKVINTLGTLMLKQPETADEWDFLRQQIQKDGALPVELIEDGLRRVKEKIIAKEWGSESIMKEVSALKERLQESHRNMEKVMLSLMEDFYPLAGECEVKASTLRNGLGEGSLHGKTAMEGFEDFVRSLRLKIQEDFRYVNSGFLSLLNQVKELERTLAKDFGGDEQIRKVDVFEMRLSEQVGFIISSFNVYSTVAEIKHAVVEKIENIKRMIRLRKEEETERLLSAQKSIQGLQMRIAEAEKAAQEMAKKAEESRIAAMKDGLTGLYNRKALDLRLADALRNSLESGVPLSLIVMDVNDFKSINDSFGHLAGDKVLQKVAQVLNETFRKGDFIARFGGDEFAAIIEGMSLDMGLERISSFRKNLGKRRFTSYRTGDIHVSVSAGTALAKAGDTAESLLERADKAMYEEKNKT